MSLLAVHLQRPVRVAIAGVDAAGKTTLAHVLAATLTQLAEALGVTV
jgi:uridine kinase